MKGVPTCDAGRVVMVVGRVEGEGWARHSAVPGLPHPIWTRARRRPPFLRKGWEAGRAHLESRSSRALANSWSRENGEQGASPDAPKRAVPRMFAPAPGKPATSSPVPPKIGEASGLASIDRWRSGELPRRGLAACEAFSGCHI